MAKSSSFVHMSGITVRFQELSERAQCRVWQAMQSELLARGTVQPRQQWESERSFNERLQPEVGYYLACYHFAHDERA